MNQREMQDKVLSSRPTFVHATGVQANTPANEKIKAIQNVATAATDFSWLTSGDSVFIKPTVNSGKMYPATTDPLAVIALIRLLKGKGAGRIVLGDLAGIKDVRFYKDFIRGSTRSIMEQTGIAQASQQEGGEVLCFEEAGWDGFFPETPLKGTHWKNPLMVPSVLKEMDHLILLPRCARHLMAGATLGMKAAVGYLRTDTKIELHRDAHTFHEKIAEANTIPSLLNKQRLVLTVADKVLSTFGPNDGYVTAPNPGLVIASNSLLSHDMVSLAWLMENRSCTPQKERMKPNDTSKRFANASNRNTVFLLSRQRITTLRSEPLRKTDLKTILDDPVLHHAFSLHDCIPQVIIKPINGSVPDELYTKLQKAVTLI
jgi:uncharacterized protein (DUF362 family)